MTLDHSLINITNFDQLIRYLEDELDWPCEQYGFEDITFEYSPSDLGIKEEDSAQIKEIHQLRPFFSGQPWGIFFIEFEKKRLPVALLRRVLSHLVVKKRASANRPGPPPGISTTCCLSRLSETKPPSSARLPLLIFTRKAAICPPCACWDGMGRIRPENGLRRPTLKEKLRWPQNPKDVEAWQAQWTSAFRHKSGFVILYGQCPGRAAGGAGA